jgi:nucleoside-diphosphate-sugar epimerase
MRILITGVNGFIGSQIANYFAKKGCEIIGIGRQQNPSDLVVEKIEYICWDLRFSCVHELKADVVLHSAALAADKGQFSDFFDNNVTATQNLLNALHGNPIFIYVSTSSVYRFNEYPAKEGDTNNEVFPLSNYGRSKLLAERLILDCENLNTKFILRPRSVYGVHDRLILPRLLNLVKGEKIIIPKHITKFISLTHIENFIYAVDLCIQNPLKQGTYNIADEFAYDLSIELPNLIGAATGMELSTMEIPKFIWESAVQLNEIFGFHSNLSRFGSDQLTKIALLDISEAQENLNYRPMKKIDDSFTDINNWINSIGGWKVYRSFKK